jgi:hypothetical protein
VLPAHLGPPLHVQHAPSPGLDNTTEPGSPAPRTPPPPPKGVKSQPAKRGQFLTGADSWIILDAGDAQAKGQLERQHRFLRSNFEPRRSFANHLDFQDQLDRWAEKVNARTHRTIRGIPAERLTEERQQRPLESATVETDRRWVTRIPQQPLIRVDRNDYSIDPVFAGRRVEVRVSQREITAMVLDTGELAAQHSRIFAGFQTIVDPTHQGQLELQRKRRRQRHHVDVQQRPLSVYDALIA